MSDKHSTNRIERKEWKVISLHRSISRARARSFSHGSVKSLSRRRNRRIDQVGAREIVVSGRDSKWSWLAVNMEQGRGESNFAKARRPCIWMSRVLLMARGEVELEKFGAGFSYRSSSSFSFWIEQVLVSRI